MSDYARTLPIFIGHGTADPVVPFKLGQRAVEHLTSNCGIKMATKEGLVGVTFKSYGSMGHHSSPQELDDIAEFLRRAIPPIPE
jgi:predicted esterase